MSVLSEKRVEITRLVFCVGMSLGMAGAATAQEEPQPGCYTRIYSHAHLEAHPKQVVAAMRMRVREEDDYLSAVMEVTFADQGHAGREGFGGRTLSQYLDCLRDADGTPFCAVECDGGSFTVTRQDATGLTLSTEYLVVGDRDSCGGVVDLAEIPGLAVKYRLNRVVGTQCEGM